ncbi:putative Membrane-spanning ATPase [Taphrina deformans PYCC 5710]|uniref:Membrane-spanning ATPase n=1 Tax=Taphrina deformans (strain PYCC 5710 / ATCC 11124 / CBS 356.35 / IMI 108563 / JCM 9778 / NBRC 8474) TaxID=1097556 RepID=R4X7C7_TAPDE|nr:putative Membrane-spanning ATPase [Taphrina deformans PYCC 5710]|eukprot:CCG81226.1 putative Membrane-spanning ATPase [Taphrina deformans PYCC 5710]
MSGILSRVSKFFADAEISRSDILRIILAASTTYAAIFYLLSSLDPNSAKRKGDSAKRREAVKRLQATTDGHKLQDLNEYEQSIASEVVFATDIKVTFESIGGLDDIINDLKESIILPLTYPELFASATGLLGAPKGVLLYGPPGCGKTMLAKALASSSGATFINMHISTLTDKWFGESNKLVNALFSLARKLQPSIIFIDEIDAFLREREKNDHEAMAMIKAEFMSLWDGLATESDTKIVVLGATNRPNDIDSAILRRMPKRFNIQLPNVQQRQKILNLILKGSKQDDAFSIPDLARRTGGMSGSAIQELCRSAAMKPVREFIREHGVVTGSANGELDIEKLKAQGTDRIRPLRNSDFDAGVMSSSTDSSSTIQNLVENLD